MTQFQLKLKPDQMKALYIALCYLYDTAEHSESIKEYFETWQSNLLEEIPINDFERFHAILCYIVDEIIEPECYCF